jgi:DNA repair exonuclease SbcCD ATPase subunit
VLTLRQLSFKNIGRFSSEQSVDFSTLSDFIQVDAINKNTGGSSGSGKSTIFNALDYLLGLNDTPTTVLQSRLTKEPISVHGVFNWDGDVLEITRGGGKLKIYLEGKIIEGSNALAEEKIDEILGMPRDLFRKILHKRQKEGGFFLDFTPKKMHEFLIDCLNLSDMRKKAEIVDLRLKELLDNKTKIEGELTAIKYGLDSNENALQAIGEAPKPEISRETILELKANLESAEALDKVALDRYKDQMLALESEKPDIKMVPFDSSLGDRYRDERTALERKLATLFANEQDRLTSVKANLYTQQSEVQKLEFQVKSAENLKIEAMKLSEQLKKIRGCQCPTCLQQWSDDSAKRKEAEILSQLEDMKPAILGMASLKDMVKTRNEEITALKTQLIEIVHPEVPAINEAINNLSELVKDEQSKYDAHTEKHNTSNNALLQNFYNKQKDIQAKQSAAQNQIRGQMEIARSALQIAMQKLKSFDNEKNQYEKTFNSLSEYKKTLTKNVEECTFNLETTVKSIFMAEEMKKAIKMYVSYSFDGALEDIGSKATEIIRCIPNMSNATIHFESTKETKDGKVKEEVNAVIGMDGEVGIPIKSLSGGERSAVDLAVDLAVIDFIETKSAKGMNLFILDEPFTGLGTIEIEMALEVLKNSNTNKKIIIVDHNPEIKQMVQSRIVIERDGIESTIIEQSRN